MHLNQSINISNSSHSIEPESFSFNLFEWCLLISSIAIFIIGIIGNLLVVLVVLKNSQMRTITNIFIVNLAIGDFFVILICLPPTIVTDLTGNWWFGKTMCKLIPYIQYISVCISVLTLTSISYERYYAIVYPLKFQASKFRAKIIIIIIWVFSILINLPHPIVITMKQEIHFNYCYPTWENIYQIIFDLTNFLILYILPMSLIFYTYSRVLKVLWRLDKSIAWNEKDEKKSDSKRSTSNYRTTFNTYNFRSKSNVNDISITVASGSSSARSKMKSQLIARRKAAKMLIIVAAMFGICYLPIHLLNILRFIGSNLLENALGHYAHVIFQIAHCLVYLNSCINPLIYNFMSDNFRKEFSKILYCKSTKAYLFYTDIRHNDVSMKLTQDHNLDKLITRNNSEFDRDIKMYNITKKSALFTHLLNDSFKSNKNGSANDAEIPRN